MIDGADIIGGELYVSYQQDACSHIYVYDLNGKMQQEVSLPGIGSASVSGNKDSKECFVSFASFTQPWTVYQYDRAANSLQPYAVPKVNFKLSDYETKQVFYTSKDGTRVPLFITYKKGLKLNGKNPVYLYAYGGFNISMNPSFSASRIPFLGAVASMPRLLSVAAASMARLGTRRVRRCRSRTSSTTSLLLLSI